MSLADSELTKIPWYLTVGPDTNQVTVPNIASQMRSWYVFALFDDGSSSLVEEVALICGEDAVDFGAWGNKPKLYVELMQEDGTSVEPRVLTNTYWNANHCWYFLPSEYRDDYDFTGTYGSNDADHRATYGTSVKPFTVELGLPPIPSEGHCGAESGKPTSHPSTAWAHDPIPVKEPETVEVEVIVEVEVEKIVEVPVIVEAQPTGLTASTVSAPANHNGSTKFTVEVQFSEDIETSYRDLPRGFAVIGAVIGSVKRVDKRNDLWTLRVTPASIDDIVISLVAGAPCNTGAPCTGDGGTMAAPWSVTIPKGIISLR